MTSHAKRLRRNAAVVGATAVLLGLLFLYPTSTNQTGSPTATAAKPGVVSTGPANGVLTVNGTSAGTRYGPVQVRVLVRSRRLVAVTALVYPSSGQRDQEISSFALPQLEREAIAAQSAQIDTVSGATFTSDGYRRSLQSALDAAHLQG
ncbi:FMN-binding protein [Kribbella sp. NBC_00889]|uniref:FMN-binding protein n=1 Tax=Kribbella sp. NBC_00889 TaxID=2975974 RepID=UPI003863870F|nr:FMN-binding protein [Kribbella sp. NBC_00889]